MQTLKIHHTHPPTHLLGISLNKSSCCQATSISWMALIIRNHPIMFQEPWKTGRHIRADCKFVFRVRKHWPLHFICITSQLRPVSAGPEAPCRGFIFGLTTEISSSKAASLIPVSIYSSEPIKTLEGHNWRTFQRVTILTLIHPWGLRGSSQTPDGRVTTETTQVFLFVSSRSGGWVSSW